MRRPFPVKEQEMSERPTLLDQISKAGYAIFRMSEAQDRILEERLRIKAMNLFDWFNRPMDQESMDRLRGYIEDLKHACRQLGKTNTEIQRIIKEQIPEYDQWFKPDEQVAAEAILIARQLGLDGLMMKRDAEIEQEIKNL
jgi:hypothetical protein